MADYHKAGSWTEDSFGIPQHDEVVSDFAGATGRTYTNPDTGITKTYDAPTGSITTVRYYLKGFQVGEVIFGYDGTNLTDVKRVS